MVKDKYKYINTNTYPVNVKKKKNFCMYIRWVLRTCIVFKYRWISCIYHFIIILIFMTLKLCQIKIKWKPTHPDVSDMVTNTCLQFLILLWNTCNVIKNDIGDYWRLFTLQNKEIDITLMSKTHLTFDFNIYTFQD